MTLQTWLTARYSTIGNQLGWDATTYANIVTDTLELMDGVEADFEDIDLHRVGVYVLWKKAADDTSGDVDNTTDGSTYKMSQAHEQFVANMNRAASECAEWLGNSDVIIETVISKDPYSYNEDRDNAGF
jgi:hypothetical protein